MRHAPILIIGLLFHLLSGGNNLSAQTISYVNPDTFYVCQSAPFEVTITNTSGNTLQFVTVTVEFTTLSAISCGIEYELGSANGATELDVTNLSMPVFDLDDLLPNEAITFTFGAIATCATDACIDMGEVFVNGITLNSSGGSNMIITDPYTPETGRLVITNVVSPVMQGSQGQILTRKITLQNTRPASLTEILFTDKHQGGLSVTTDVGEMTLANDYYQWQVRLNGDDFVNLGIGSTFDFMESLTIEEEILIKACGFDTVQSVSNISIEWGCNGTACQKVETNTVVELKASTLVPDLIFEPIVNFGNCFCGPDSVLQAMKVKNIGEGRAIDISVFIDQIAPNGGINIANIRMDSAGFEIPLEVLPLESPKFDDPICTHPEDWLKSMDVLVPSLDVGAEVTILWDVFFCAISCNRAINRWQYSWNYFKECPPDPFIELGDTLLVSSEDLHIDTDLNIDFLPPLEDDSTYQVKYMLEYPYLTTAEGILTLEFFLPCGLIWVDSNQLILNGENPEIITEQIGEDLFVTAMYALPFDHNVDSTFFAFSFDCDLSCLASNCQDSLVTSCEEAEVCTIFPTPGIPLDVTTSITHCLSNDIDCGLQDCNGITFGIDCPIEICPIIIPGYIGYTFEAARSNFGLPDNDDNFLPDPGGMIDMNLVRKDRLIAGDTVHTEFHGIVITEDPNTSFQFGLVEIGLSATDLGFQNVDLLSPEGISEVYSKLRVFDNSAGVWYECDNVMPEIDTAGFRYQFNLNAATLMSCGAPNGFVLEEGDSILYEGDYKINYNLLRVDPIFVQYTLMSLIDFTPRAVLFNDPNADTNELFSCGCERSKFELSGIEYLLEDGVFPIPPCDTSLLKGANLFQLELQWANFFPFEYRNLATLTDLQMQMPEFITPVNSIISYIRYQNGQNFIQDLPILPTFADSTYTFDLAATQNPPLDEGFLILFRHQYITECDIIGSHDLNMVGHLDFADNIPQDPDPLEVNNPGVDALRGLLPILSFKSTCVDTTLNNLTVLDFELINNISKISSQESGTAENVWLYPVPNPGLDSIILVNAITGDTFLTTNNIFQLDTIGKGDTIALQLIGLNKSCEKVELELRFGWSCDPYTNPIYTPCYEDKKIYDIFPLPAEIDMFVTSPMGCSDLCDTVPYHSIEIFNADQGAVFDLELKGTIPTGLVILSGSSEVEYPSGSGSFFPLADPDIIGAGQVVWKVTDALDTLKTRGLPGIGAAPNHAITVRFLMLDSCNFVAGSYPIFTASGRQNCGDPTNRISKPGNPLCTNGVEAPYSAILDVAVSPNIECNDQVQFQVSFEATDTTLAGDCVIVELPPNINYVSGSCLPVTNPQVICPPEIDANRLTFRLPANVPNGSTIAFSFEASGFSSLECAPTFMLFQAATQTFANCVAIGDTCSTKVSTAFLPFELEIERPEFDLSNFTINALQTSGNDLVNYSIDITNISEVAALPPTTLDFYIDISGNGIGDMLVFFENIGQIINPSQTLTLTGSFELFPGNLCQLIAMIDEEKHCACQGDQIPVVTPINYTLAENFVACSNEPTEIGVPETPGFFYQWIPSDYLTCPTCATTNFQKNNPSITFEILNYTLICTDNMGCVIENEVEVQVQPAHGIFSVSDTSICIGETINFIATEGMDYEWQGEGTIDGLQIQSTSPTFTQTYSVTVTDAEGCTGSEAITVIVHQLPVVDAGNDTLFCSGATAQLQTPFDPSYTYQWTPTNLLDNPNIFNPSILQSIDTQFFLQVTDANGCENADSIQVNFAVSPIVTITPDSTAICEGSATILEAFGADAYEWSPMINLTCLNPPECSQVQVTPESTTVFQVIGVNSSACTDTAFATVTVGMNVVTMGETVMVCETELPVIIFGDSIDIAGVYCDTLQLPSGCDSVVCIELVVFETAQTVIDTTICPGDSIVILEEFCVFTNPGTDTCYLNTINGCDSLVIVNVTILTLQDVSIQVSVPDTIALSTPVDLSVEDIYTSYTWFAGDELLPECQDSPFCTHDFPDSSLIYSVIVTTEAGCTLTSSYPLAVLNFCEPNDLEIPNAFTPDFDETNDYFRLPANEFNTVQVLALEIWDRWGEKIYEGSGDTAAWDGTKDGEPMPSDVYIYILLLGCAEDAGLVVKLVGDVTLLR